MDFPDDEWDPLFTDFALQAASEAENAASRNPNPTPTPTPGPAPIATAAASCTFYSSAPLPPHPSAPSVHWELAQCPPSYAAVASGSEVTTLALPLAPTAGRGYSPPRELSQRPAAEEIDGNTVRLVVPAGGDSFRGGAARRERDSREVERLTRELKRASKQINDLKNECNELKKDRTKKDLESKAKDAEIQNLKEANVGCATKDNRFMGMDIDKPFHTPANGVLHAGGSCWTSTRRVEKLNEKNVELCSSRDGLSLNERHQTDASVVLELKHRTTTNDRTSTSGDVPLEECGKYKEMKTIGVQIDLPRNSEHLECKKNMLERLSSNLCAIWGMPANSLLGRNMISKILVSCSEDIFQLLQSTRSPNETSYEASSSMNVAISKVYDIIVKMNSDIIHIQTLLEALLNLCAVGNAFVVGRALRILHHILQHLLNYETKSSQRNNVFIEPYVSSSKGRNNHEGSSTLLNLPAAENLLRSNDGLHIGNMFLPFTFWTSLFTAILQIGVKHSEESIRIDAVSIMILIVRTSDPKEEREKFGFSSVLENLHQLLQKENGLLVKKHSVQLLFLLLNCPTILKLLCGGGKDGSELLEAVGSENDRPQQAISSVLKDLSECLITEATSSLELKLCRQVVVLLEYIASSGKLGYEVLLGSVGARGANFLELIMEVLASQMDYNVDCSSEAQELLKDRYLLMREALILLNRLASHVNFAKRTLEVLMSKKLCATLTIDIANRLPQRSKYPLKQLYEINPQMANDLAELAQKFHSRVYSFLEEQHINRERHSGLSSH